MATKSIVSTRTLHVEGPNYKPPVIDPVTGGHQKTGNYDVKEIKPGELVELDEKEADKLLATYPDWVSLAPEKAAPATTKAATPVPQTPGPAAPVK